MRRPLSADPIFFCMLDAEARILGCSAPTIIRTATLDFIARNHQTRIPSMFKEELELSSYTNAIKKIYILFTEDEQMQKLHDIATDQPKNLRLVLYDCTLQLLEKAREKTFKHSRPRIKDEITP